MNNGAYANMYVVQTYANCICRQPAVVGHWLTGMQQLPGQRLSQVFLPREKILPLVTPLQNLSSSGGLIMASINAPHLLSNCCCVIV